MVNPEARRLAHCRYWQEDQLAGMPEAVVRNLRGAPSVLLGGHVVCASSVSIPFKAESSKGATDAF